MYQCDLCVVYCGILVTCEPVGGKWLFVPSWMQYVFVIQCNLQIFNVWSQVY